MSQTTKRALEASLKKLLLRKPLNKITISDITEDCGVNRMTFYYHFKDIYDLVDWILMEDAACIPVAYYNDFWLQSPSLKGTWHSPYGYWYLQYGYIEE